MAFLQFNDFQLVKIMDTSETVEIGQLTPKNNGEIQYIRLCVYKLGTLTPSNLTLTCRLHTSSDLTAVYAASTAVTLATVEDADNLNTTGDWLSWVRFDFSRQNINKNLSYYVSCIATNYTRNADTFYIGFPYGFPYPTYNPSSNINNFTDGPLAMQWFSYQEPA